MLFTDTQLRELASELDAKRAIAQGSRLATGF